MFDNEENNPKEDARTTPQDAARTSASMPAHNEPSTVSDKRELPALAIQTSPGLPHPHHRLLERTLHPCAKPIQNVLASSAVELPHGPGTKEQELPTSRRALWESSRHLTSGRGNVTSELHVPCCMDDCDVDSLQATTLLPPVTTETLQELDLHWVQNNVDLRVDVHFDHDLHFMPVSGRRGEEKRLEAGKYWECLEFELRIYQHNSTQECQECLDLPPTSTFFCPRLPVLFKELRKLLFLLVPERERDEVDQTLDMTLLMQQIRNNALDIVRLSEWLSDLLTTHCAPVRDEWAKDMARKISEGSRQGDMASLVAGLEKLFSFCEAMKLDVVNHQIRTFRIPLIEDGVSFQRDYFSTRVQNGKFDVKSSQDWFVSVVQRLLEKEEQEKGGPDVLVAGLVELCILPDLPIPKTMKHDSTRIRQVQEELQDILHLHMCLIVFDQSVYGQCGPNFHPSAMHQALRTRIMDLTDCDTDVEGPASDLWQNNIETLAIELTRALSSLARKADRTVSANQQFLFRRELMAFFQKENADHAVADIIAKDLRSRVLGHAAAFRKLTPLRISMLQKQYQKDRQTRASTRLMPDLDDIARRLAHMVVIHWQVWGGLAYPTGDLGMAT